MTITSNTVMPETKQTRLFSPSELTEDSYFKEDMPSGADCTDNYHRSSWNEMSAKEVSLHDNEMRSVKKTMLWR